MTYRDHLPPRPGFPLKFSGEAHLAQAMSARSDETEGLGPQDASAVPERHAPGIFARLRRLFRHTDQSSFDYSYESKP
ncbi:MAG: hypothetical protein EOP20_12205 [Hyphomicrobiales bacterium]|nr:MAG: hypothetical protein EOP20_12205 [Hyphomicrobiales bacterium]